MNKVVWVLGAGFSRPLGGPLLPDLLAPTSYGNVLAAFPSLRDIDGPERKQVLGIYSAHRYASETVPGQRLWRDAEEFLDYLDTAALVGGPAADRLRQLIGECTAERLVALAHAARSMVAAECAAFLVGADLGTERWAPYVRWFESLGPDDAVITFNYDLVLERLEKRTPGKINVVLPGGPLAPKTPSLFKLHGSVDWKRVPGPPPSFRDGQDEAFPLSAGVGELAVATPGPTKATRSRELEELWRFAENAIKTASAVVFIGYRFPPSDNAARLRLLRALAANESIYLAVHTVLGPRLQEDDTVRMKQLLLSAMRQSFRLKAPPDRVITGGSQKMFSVVQHALWAQDFLGYVPGGHILQANLHSG